MYGPRMAMRAYSTVKQFCMYIVDYDSDRDEFNWDEFPLNVLRGNGRMNNSLAKKYYTGLLPDT